jgi:hypothetical protein
MARLRLYPHRTADADSVSWHAWWLERDGVRSALPQLLSGWDYASDETLGISVDLDEPTLLASSGLGSIDDLEILVMADCAHVQERFSASGQLADHEPGATLDVRLRLPPGRAAGAVRLSAHLVLARTTPVRGDRIAHLRGARIHSSEPFTLRLEGDSSRFPTDPVPFSELGLGNAPWTVLTVYDDLSDSFMGGVRLLINTEHPVGQISLDPRTAPRMSRLLRAEILRLLISKVAGHLEEADGSTLDEGSVGRVLETMCQIFLDTGLRTAARVYREDPVHFELLLHDRLEPLAGVIA